MELLRSWVNDELKLSRPVSSFEVDMANGYLIGEILVRHGLLPGHAPLEALQDKESPNAKISNFGMVQQALLDLGVKFDSQIANSIMTEKKGVATNLCYQLRLGLQNAKGAGKPVTRRGVAEPVLMGSTIKVAQPPTAQPAAPTTSAGLPFPTHNHHPPASQQPATKADRPIQPIRGSRAHACPGCAGQPYAAEQVRDHAERALRHAREAGGAPAAPNPSPSPRPNPDPSPSPNPNPNPDPNQAADDPKELSQAVNLSRFTEHMLTQQHEAEKFDQIVRLARTRTPIPNS